ncbi:MAG: hypothetical protein WC796_01705 [Candidatus Pacearchaeota archaeon]|jgi:hypothetical protein
MISHLKKGELPVSWTVTIILLLIGFVILLVIYFEFFNFDMIDRQACHKSVLLRGSLPYQSVSQGYVPLQCKTQKICITGDSGGKCTEFKNEEKVRRVKVLNNERGLDEIQKLYAQEILDCWSMMGEGKLSIFSPSLSQSFQIGSLYPNCVICSRIAIDEKTLDKVGLNKLNIFEYMNTHLVPSTNQTYLQYITGEDFAGIAVDDQAFNEFVKQQVSSSGTGGVEGELNGGGLEGETDYVDDEVAVLFMQVSRVPSALDVAKKDILVALGMGAGATATYISVGGATFGWSTKLIGWVSSVPVIRAGVAVIALVAGTTTLSTQAINLYKSKSVVAASCSDVEVGNGVYSGCSVVRTVKYDSQEILKNCKKIQSIP